MPRNSLPQNNILVQPTTVQDFESLTNWTVSGGSCTLALDSTIKKEGTSSLAVTSLNAGGFTQFYKNGTWDFSQTECIEFWFYVPVLADFAGVSLYLFTDAGYSKYFLASVSPSALAQGWNRIHLKKSDFAGTGSPSWVDTVTRIRFAFTPATGKNITVNFDSLKINQVSKPSVILTFDDGYSSVYSVAKPLLDARGFKYSCYVNTDSVGTAGRMTKAQLTEIYNAGSDVSNHTTDHTNLTTVDYATAKTKVETARTWLVDNGFERTSNFFAYPYNANNDTTKQVMVDLGITAARISGSKAQLNPYDDIHKLVSYPIENTQSISTIMGYIEDAIKRGATVILYLHKVVETATDTLETSTATFTALLDYLVGRKVDVVSMSEWHAQLTNPRKQI